MRGGELPNAFLDVVSVPPRSGSRQNVIRAPSLERALASRAEFRLCLSNRVCIDGLPLNAPLKVWVNTF